MPIIVAYSKSNRSSNKRREKSRCSCGTKTIPRHQVTISMARNLLPEGYNSTKTSHHHHHHHNKENQTHGAPEERAPAKNTSLCPPPHRTVAAIYRSAPPTYLSPVNHKLMNQRSLNPLGVTRPRFDIKKIRPKWPSSCVADGPGERGSGGEQGKATAYEVSNISGWVVRRELEGKE